MAEETLTLGGNIQLTGFSGVEQADLIVVKKIVGNYVKKMADHLPHFSGLNLTMKKIHEKEGEPLFELHGKVIGKNKIYVSTVNDRNLYVGLDQVLKKISAEIGIR